MIPMAARVAAVLASALLYIAAYPPSDQRWTALVALVPFLLALRATSLGQSIALGFVWSLAMSYGVTSWLIGAVVRYFDQSWYVGVAMLAGTTLVGASVEYCAVALCHRAFARRYAPAVVVLLTASAWAAAELCRTRIGFGNPWGLFGYAIVGDGTGVLWPALAQVADLGGVYAVTFVLVSINAGIAEALAAATRRDFARGAGALVLGAVVAVSAYGYGRARLSAVSAQRGASVPIAIVQANLDLGSQWREEMYGANLAEHLELTDRVLHEHQPRIRTIFWPENSMTFFVDKEPAYRAAIGRVLAAYDAELVAGAPRFENPDQPAYFNSVFVFRPDGEISARYDKRRLMPFAEYFPLSMIDLLRRSFGRVRTFEAATPLAPMPSRAGKLGVIVCNEAIYPDDAATRAREGAEVLANLSNDSWVEGTEFAENQLRIATLRAIEQRRWLVRASTSGPSAIVEPTGRIVTRSEPHTLAVLTGEVRPRTNVSIYGRYGDAFAWTCLAVTLTALVATRRRRANAP
jgi:apolipoprotein N-acyltransferase